KAREEGDTGELDEMGASAEPGDAGEAVEPVAPAFPILGLIALRGVPQGGAGAAAMHDLAIIASWCARALAPGERRSLPAPAVEAHEASGIGVGVGSVVRFHV